MNESEPTLEVQRLFVRHTDRIEAFILALLPDFAVSKDLLQEVFITAVHKAADFRPGSDFVAWARAIARNKVLQHLQQTPQRLQLLDPEVLESLAGSASAMDEGWEGHRKALAECMKALTPRVQEIVNLRYAPSPRPPREIALKLSWTPAAVRVALARARKLLHECVERRMVHQEA